MYRHPSEYESRRRAAEMLFDFELACIENGFTVPEGEATLHYDERHDVFRFSDGTFALGREYANWPEMERRGYKTW